jgi:LysM repeat protein
MGVLDTPSQALGGIIDPITSAIKSPFKKDIKDWRKQDFPEGFYFVEILNGQEQTHEAVSLKGNQMPMIPFEFGGEQRITKDYYPGNSEPAVQVLGPKESDVTIHGKLKDKRYRDKNLYGVSTEIQRLIDAIRIRGNLLRITLGEWQRYGFLEKTDFKMNSLGDVEYSLTFTIVGFNKPINAKFVQKTKEKPIAKDLINKAEAFQAKTPPVTLSLSLADQIGGAISSVASALALVTHFVDSVVSTAEDVQKSANRAIGLIKHARTTIIQFNRRIGNIATGFNSLSNDTRAATNFNNVMKNQGYILDLMTSSSSLAATLAAMQKQFEALSKFAPLARYKVKDGDSLQKISLKFYNSADHWDKLYDHNKLTSTQLSTGMLLEIPRL